LATDGALIFYESLRPIRCHKIRYFADRNFTVRIHPAPVVPVTEIVQEARTPRPAAPSSEELTDKTFEEFRVRDATIEDIDRLDQLELSDFAAPLDDIPVPQVDRLSPEQLQELAGRFNDTLRSVGG
jgi:hypothetical protein